MCFYIQKSAKPKIADKDIICWKFLNLELSPFFTGNHGALPPYQKEKINPHVKLRKMNSSVSFKYENEPIVLSEIHKGYHSYKTENCMLSGAQGWMFTRGAKFIIPKGTRYYENDTEYVSETIMML